MKIYTFSPGESIPLPLIKYLIIMKLIALFLLMTILQANAKSYAQTITLSGKNISIENVFKEIKKQTKYNLICNTIIIRETPPVNVHAVKVPLNEFLDQLAEANGLTYVIENKTIAVKKKPVKKERPAGPEAIQQRSVSGNVTDQNGQPLPGVSVMVKNTQKGTSTDLEGNYEIEAEKGDILEFSFLGYASQEIAIEEKIKIDVVLQQSLSELDEIVVIGYGTQKKRDLTGAVSQINATRLENENPNAVSDVLRGNIPGLNVGYSTSAKGGGSLQVRGQNTLNANGSPLIVLDGVIYYGSLNDINPNDIETIDVLKDASSAAVYGAKAASGVVLVTTKKGSGEGKPVINLNSSFGLATMSVDQPVYQPEEFVSWRQDVMRSMTADYQPHQFDDPRTLPSDLSVDEWLSYDNSDGDPVRVWLQRLNFQSVEIGNYMNGQSIDWYDRVFQTGLRQDHTLSLSGKKDEISYYWSIGYLDNQGIVVGDKYNTLRTRLNLEGNVTDFLTVGMNTQFADRDESQVPVSWGQMVRVSPWGSEFDDAGKLRLSPQDDPAISTNPLLAPAYTDRTQKYTNLISSLYAKVNLPWGITYQFNFSPRVEWYKYLNHQSAENPQWAPRGGIAERRRRQIYNWQIDNLIKWNKTFDEIHQLDVTLLANAEKYQSWDETKENDNFSPNDQLGYHSIGSGINPAISSNDEYGTGDALMARLFYSLKDRYMLTLSIRRDGYSAFGQRNPRATFPAAAFGWVFTEEPFFKSSWFDYGKLRFSYGVNGNRDIGRYASLSNLSSDWYLHVNSSGTVEQVPRLWVSKLSNPDLKWEETASWNVGLDFSLFNNVLEGSLEAYQMSTTDLLVERSLPDVIGFAYVWDNLGEVQNRGIELNLNTWNINRENFSWRSTVNFSLNRNKIKSLYGDMMDVLDENGQVTGQREVDDIANEWFIDHAIDAVWDIPVQGVYQIPEAEEAARYGLRPGDYKLLDANDDGNFTNADRDFLGYGEPRFRWSLRNEFKLYKRFDISFMMYSYWGHMGEFNQAKHDGYINRTNSYALPYWTADNPLNDYPRLSSSSGSASFNVYKKKSFIRLDNISMAYTFPQPILERVHLSNLKVFFNVRNVAVWAPDWEYWDPEWSLGSNAEPTDSNAGPTPRTFTLGIDLTL